MFTATFAQFSMCDSVNLITSVEKYPCIWDPNNADYHDRDVKDYAWEQVCKKVIDDWEICEDKVNTCIELKKKWTNIRDYQRKQLLKTKHSRNGRIPRKSKTYVYSQLLNFLTPILTRRDSDGNYIKEESDCTQSDVEDDNEEHEKAVYLESPVSSPAVAKKRKKIIPTQFLDVSDNNEGDDDTKFLLSFRSYMKRMNYDQKLDFKMGMLQLVKDAKLGNDPSSSQGHFDNDTDRLSTL